MSHARLDIASKQIVFARQYTWSLLETLQEEDWLRAPVGVSTHIAWQVGHLAVAQYGLCLFRMRGRRRDDASLMSSAFRKRFSRGSTPHLETTAQPPVAEIREVFQRVHQQSLEELVGYSDADLDEPVDEPYAAFSNKLGALLFCSQHEMLHAGQIGLLRRCLGQAPVR